jgi:hypothetical protein
MRIRTVTLLLLLALSSPSLHADSFRCPLSGVNGMTVASDDSRLETQVNAAVVGLTYAFCRDWKKWN